MRGLLFLVRRSLRQHALSTVITVLAVALASGLVMAVFSISAQTHDAFTGGETGFDAVLGARGSPLQLVMNTIFHLETSPGNIPWSLYQEIKRDPRVRLAIPYAVGDNYLGFRIVGTTPEIFTDFEYRKGHKFRVEGHDPANPDGPRFFDPELREAVIGSYVAQKTSMRFGSVFSPYHGIDFREKDQHGEQYVVVGVLEPTNSPSDRVIWIPIEGIYRMGGHYLRGAGENYQATPDEEIPDEHKEVSSVMLKFRGGKMQGLRLVEDINTRGKVATLAYPIGEVMAELFRKLGWVTRILTLVAYLVVAVATGSILASIYNTMNERRREFAILRALGARRGTVFSVIVAEAVSIAALGSALGIVVCGGILWGAAVVVRAQTGVVLDPFTYHTALVATPAGMLLLGALAGLLPAFKAYSTDVAENLAPQS